MRKFLLVSFVVALVLLMYFQFSTGHEMEGFAQKSAGFTHQFEGFRDGRGGGGSRGGSRPSGGSRGGSRPGGHHRPGGDYSAHARPGGGWGGYSYGWWPSYWWPYYDYLWFPSCDLTGCPDGYVCAKDPATGYSYCV
jgi:hypothetical protein